MTPDHEARAEWRFVHSQRARKLRRRGEHVVFSHWSGGRCVYVWRMK